MVPQKNIILGGNLVALNFTTRKNKTRVLLHTVVKYYCLINLEILSIRKDKVDLPVPVPIQL